MHEEKGLSVARACKVTRLSRAAYYRLGLDWGERDGPVMEALNAVLDRRPRWGFWKCFDRLRNDGHNWNNKRVHRVCCQMRLNLPRWTKKRLPIRVRQPMAAPATINAVWAIDFMSDSLYNGRRFRMLNVLDEGIREALAIEIDTRLPAKHVGRVLTRLAELRGTPQVIRMGPELIAKTLMNWCESNGVELRHIQPGNPDQNAYVERFNRTCREEVLNAYIFENLAQVRRISANWVRDYNEERPHHSLGSLPPARFRALFESTTISTSELST